MKQSFDWKSHWNHNNHIIMSEEIGDVLEDPSLTIEEKICQARLILEEVPIETVYLSETHDPDRGDVKGWKLLPSLWCIGGKISRVEGVTVLSHAIEGNGTIRELQLGNHRNQLRLDDMTHIHT